MKCIFGNHTTETIFSIKQFHYSLFELLIRRDPFISAARDEVNRAFRNKNKKWYTHLRPVDPSTLDYDIDDHEVSIKTPDILSTLE
jgi:hypothetical protein